MIHHMSLFPNKDILTKEIESWKSFGDSLSSKEEDRELFNNMLMIVTSMLLQLTLRALFPAEPLIMALLSSQHKMIDWLTKTNFKA